MWSNQHKAENYCFRYFKRRKLVNLSLAVSFHGDPYYFNFGFNNDNAPGGERALYETGSLTKLFVAAVYAHMLYKEQLTLQDSLQTLIGEQFNLAPQFRNITLGSLLQHGSGLPRLPGTFLDTIEDENDPYKDFNESIISDYLALSTDEPAGKKYMYSNLGYGILGFILSVKYGKSLYEVIKEVILDPLQMHDTTTLSLAPPGQLLDGYNSSGKKMPYWRMNCFQGAGLLISNTSDLLKYLVAHLENDPPFLFLTTGFNDSKRVALAWHRYGLLSKLLGFNGYLWHNGMTGGFSSYATINIPKKIAAAALTNKTDDLTECIIGLYGYLRT